MTSTFFIVVAVLFVTVLAFGFVQLSNIPTSIRHSNGTVSLGYRSAPVKDYIRFTVIAAVSVAGAALFTAIVAI